MINFNADMYISYYFAAHKLCQNSKRTKFSNSFMMQHAAPHTGAHAIRKWPKKKRNIKNAHHHMKSQIVMRVCVLISSRKRANRHKFDAGGGGGWSGAKSYWTLLQKNKEILLIKLFDQKQFSEIETDFFWAVGTTDAR